MIQVAYSNYFLKSVKKLGGKHREKLAELLEILRQNPFSSLLHTKALTGKLTGFYSFRITRDWRVIFQFVTPEKIKLTDIGHRKDIYKS